jgi:hypothetical protein
MAIVIRKRVGLEFLGEDYKEAYLIFQSIPVSDFESMQVRLKALQDKEQGAVQFILDTLKQYFVSGEFPDDAGKLEPVKKEDLDGLDPQTAVECFKVFTGQELDPKVETPSTSISPTEASPPSSS